MILLWFLGPIIFTIFPLYTLMPHLLIGMLHPSSHNIPGNIKGSTLFLGKIFTLLALVISPGFLSVIICVYPWCLH